MKRRGWIKSYRGLLKFLGIEKDDIEINESENGNVTLTVTLNPDSYKNKGQAKKIAKNSDDEPGRTLTASRKSPIRPGVQKRMQRKNTALTKNLRENNGNSANGKGNKNADEPDDESPGKSNGKKNK